MFTVNNGVDQLSWNGGPWVTGTQKARNALLRLEFESEGKAVGFPTGPTTTEDHLSNPLSALYLMLQVLGPTASITGEAPTVPSLAPGTVS